MPRYSRTATYMPTSSSLSTLNILPIPNAGEEISLQESVIAFLPTINPALEGPHRSFPPLKSTTEAPFCVYAHRFSAGGSFAAASTMSGTRYFGHTGQYASKDGAP